MRIMSKCSSKRSRRTTRHPRRKPSLGERDGKPLQELAGLGSDLVITRRAVLLGQRLQKEHAQVELTDQSRDCRFDGDRDVGYRALRQIMVDQDPADVPDRLLVIRLYPQCEELDRRSGRCRRCKHAGSVGGGAL